MSLSGDVEMIAGPFSVQEGAVESDSVARLILESEGVTLSSALDVDITASGVFNEIIDLSPGSIAEDTVVNSYLLHADSPGGGFTYEGTIIFAQPILGVMISTDNLQASDAIAGSPSTTYPVIGSNDANTRGLELGISGFRDEITVILPDTVHFLFDNHTTYDHVRVITAVPEPSSLAILAIGGALTIGVTLCRRRRSAGGTQF